MLYHSAFFLWCQGIDRVLLLPLAVGFGSSLKKSKTKKLVWIQNFDCTGNRNVVYSFCNNIFDKQDVLAADNDSQDLNSVFLFVKSPCLNSNL